MKLTKNDLKQLIREMMEAEEMEAEVEEKTEGDSEGKIRIKAELRDDPAFEAAQEDAVGNDYGGQNTYEMAKYIVTLPDGEEIVIPDLRTLEDVEGDAVIGKAFAMAQGYQGGTEEDKIEGFKGAQGPGGIGEDGELIDNQRGTFQVFIDGFEIPKAGPASEELIDAFKKYKNRKPRYVSYKSARRGPSRRPAADDARHDARRPGYKPFRRFEEGKLTKSKLLQIIREEMEAELEEKSSGPLHDAYYAMRDFVDNLQDEALQEEAIDLADDLFDAIHDVMPFPDQD